jgi:hypothetical protein
VAQVSAQISCPKIRSLDRAIGPCPETHVAFSLSIDSQSPQDIQIEWTVSFGEIENGQGTPEFLLQTKEGVYSEEILVKAIVKGLPTECVNIAEGKTIRWKHL